MDDISLLGASIFYSVFLTPLLTMFLLLFWTSANMKNTAKAQLLGIAILFALGFLAINSSAIIIIDTIAIIVLVAWIFAYRTFFFTC